MTKIGRGLAKGASKHFGTRVISATVESNDFIFGTQLGFG